MKKFLDRKANREVARSIEAREIALELGRTARDLGVPRGENPYNYMSAASGAIFKAAWWSTGWAKRDQELRKAEFDKAYRQAFDLAAAERVRINLLLSSPEAFEGFLREPGTFTEDSKGLTVKGGLLPQ